MAGRVVIVFMRDFRRFAVAFIAAGVCASAAPVALKTGEPIKATINRGGSHRYSVFIPPDSCIPFRLRQLDIDVWLKGYAPSGETVLDLNWDKWGEERYSICSVAGGRYELEVPASATDSNRGSYTLIAGQRRIRRPDEPDLMQLQESVSKAIEARTEVSSLEIALEAFRQVKNPWAEMKVQSHLARAHHRRAEYAATIRNQVAALNLARRLGDRAEEAISLRELIRAYGQVGELNRRAARRSEYIGLTTGSEDARMKAAGYVTLGTVRVEKDQFQDAARNYDRAHMLYRSLGASDEMRDVLKKFVFVYLNTKQFQKAYETSLQYLEAERATGLAQNQAAGYATVGYTLYDFHSVRVANEAESYMQTAAALHRMTGDKSGEASAHLTIASSAALRGDFKEALRRIDYGARLLEGVRASAGSAKWRAFLERHAYRRTKAAILMTLHGQDASSGYDAAALATADSMRAEYLASSSATIDQMQSLVSPDALMVEFLIMRGSSYLWALDGSRLQSFRLPGLEVLRPLLDGFQAAIVARNRTVASETTDQRALRIARADKILSVLGAQLSQHLLSPVAAILGNRKLMIITDRPLEQLPFAALRDPVDPAGRAIGHAREVVYLPSAGSVLAMRREREAAHAQVTGVAVVADPVFRSDDPRFNSRANQIEMPEPLQAATRSLGLKTIPRLLYSRIEGDSIGSYARDPLLLFGFDATRDAFMTGRLRDYRIVHFAAHGLINRDDPDYSGLVLSLVDRAGKPLNGFLRFQDVYEQEINSELAVLSACQTAIGRSYLETGMMTLAGAFLHAGAARVLSTLWKIDDEATAEFMKIFYRELLANKATPRAALKTAQTELARVPRWRSPYYWGAFVLQGWPH